MTTAEISRRRAWLMAARPQTLPAAAAPVIVGVGLAVQQGVFSLVPALAALVGAELIQIGTNFANDYYDAVKGTDDADESYVAWRAESDRTVSGQPRKASRDGY